MAQDAFDHGFVVDQRNNPHFVRTARAQERIGLPDLLDQLAPLRRGNTARLVPGDVYNRRGVAGDLSLLGAPRGTGCLSDFMGESASWIT